MKRPSLQQITLVWVSVFYFGGAEYREAEGQSWLQATLEGQPILAFFPQQSIFRFNGKLFALLHLYPTAIKDEYGLPTISIPKDYKPKAKAIALDSPTLENVTPLWESYRLQRGQSIMYRFASLL